MAYLSMERRPELHDPIAIVAFAGWNDAASAATDAARFVVRRLGARKFASIDSEYFYDFRETRPLVQMTPGGMREVQWPRNEFFYARNPTGPHDIVVGVGVEPSLRWKAFTDAHVNLYRDLGVGTVMSLGALLADVPHTRPTRVTGSAIDPEVAARLDLTASRYEGPTGIVGVLHDVLRRSGIAGASLWANVPHYITTSSNPMATAALLSRLQEVVGLAFDLRELEIAGERFVSEVNTALAGNPEIAEYVRRLEEQADANPGEEPEEDLPASEDVLMDVEEFLRSQREDDDEDTDEA
ncbi:MAG: PAC2 family protein [Hyphomicrobiales bacterium]